MIQHRVKIPEDCLLIDDSQTCQEKYGAVVNGQNHEELMKCLTATFDYRCNPSFVKDITEMGPVQIETEDDVDIVDETVYREFSPLV